MSVCGALRSNSEFLFLDTHRDIVDRWTTASTSSWMVAYDECCNVLQFNTFPRFVPILRIRTNLKQVTWQLGEFSRALTTTWTSCLFLKSLSIVLHLRAADTAVSDLLVHGVSHDSKIAINQINQKWKKNQELSFWRCPNNQTWRKYVLSMLSSYMSSFSL